MNDTYILILVIVFLLGLYIGVQAGRRLEAYSWSKIQKKEKELKNKSK